MSKMERVCGVGEVQSRTGTSDLSKASAYAQVKHSYKLMRPCSWKLNEPDELAEFAKIFISTMKYCLSDSTFRQKYSSSSRAQYVTVCLMTLIMTIINKTR